MCFVRHQISITFSHLAKRFARAYGFCTNEQIKLPSETEKSSHYYTRYTYSSTYTQKKKHTQRCARKINCFVREASVKRYTYI